MVQALSEEDEFCFQGAGLGFKLLDFWRWSASDVLNNTIRGQIAEYLVAKAVDAEQQVLDVWSPFDVKDPSGIKIEVKSAACLQSWTRKRFSRISFLVPATYLIDANTFQLSSEKRRWADVYVLAHLKHKDKATVNPLQVEQWDFYVLPTWKLDERERSQHSITLKSLQQLHGGSPWTFHQLKDAIREAGASQREHHREAPG